MSSVLAATVSRLSGRAWIAGGLLAVVASAAASGPAAAD